MGKKIPRGLAGYVKPYETKEEEVSINAVCEAHTAYALGIEARRAEITNSVNESPTHRVTPQIKSRPHHCERPKERD